MKVSEFIRLCGGQTKVAQVLQCHRVTVNNWCKIDRIPLDKINFLYEAYKDIMPQSVVKSFIEDMAEAKQDDTL
jgi:hypothetical protein